MCLTVSLVLQPKGASGGDFAAVRSAKMGRVVASPRKMAHLLTGRGS